MAAKIIERPEEVEAGEDGQVADLFETTPAEPTPTESTTPSEDDVPEKYRGKSQAELVRMHQEAEKLAGRQSGEVGDLRKAVDSLIQAQLERDLASQSNAEPEEEVDFFADPKTAMERQIANHPSVKAAEQASLEMTKQKVLAALERKHPDMNDLLSSPDFGEWIAKSPMRQRLMRQAHNQFDAEAADELFSLYKERKELAKHTVDVDARERKQAVKAAATGDVRTSAPPQAKKIYRRADIINLQLNDPPRYAQLADEIMLAYREGRVR